MIKLQGKIPITIHPVFWIIAALIGWLNSMTVSGTLIWIGIILVSVIVHEFGHALTAVAFGQRARIDLVAFGGLTMRDGPKMSLWKDFIVVINGPVAGFLLCLVAYYLWSSFFPSNSTSLVAYTLQVTAFVNFFWTIVNLIPVQPLDGGRVLSIILQGIFGMKGVRLAFLLSMIIAGVLGVLFFLIQFLIAGVIFFMLAFESYRSWRSSQALTEQDTDVDLQVLLKQAEESLHRGDKEEGRKLLERVRDTAGSGMVYIIATQELAELEYHEEKYREAYNLLLPLKKDLDGKALRLLHQCAYKIGEWHEAVDVGGRSYQFYPSYDTALINALCYAVLGQDKPAIGWLQCSVREGLPNLAEIIKKKEFDNIRDHLAFQKFLKSAGQ